MEPSGTRVGPWPGHARSAPREAGCPAPGREHAFPSGRGAIVACLRLLGIDAERVVAIPECVTDCLADAVRQCAQPLPLASALARGRSDLAAVIVYEQWGWPPPAVAENALARLLPDVTVIIDRVDSADFFTTSRSYAAFEILSLSKVLGTPAGGIARRLPDGAYLRFQPEQGAPRPATSAWSPELTSHPAVRELFKRSQHVHPAVLGWLDHNCAVQAAEAERRARSQAAQTVLDSPLAADWPNWMAHAIEAGAGPVWAPVLRGWDAAAHWYATAYLARCWGITSAVRMFAWTGNPLAPGFEPCVALPIHGDVVDVAAVVSGLSRSVA